MALSVLEELTEEQVNKQYSEGDIRNDLKKEGDPDETAEVLTGLVARVSKQFHINKTDKTDIEREMESMLEYMNNTYDSRTLSEIESMGGSKLFIPLVSQQVAGGTAWINSILESGWTIEPTPLPELPDDLRQQVMDSIVDNLARPDVPKTPDGIPLGPTGEPMKPSETEDIKKGITKEKLEVIKEEAVKRCGRMSTLIADQLVDSGYKDTLSEFVYDLCVFPTAFMKTTYKKRKKMVTTQEGSRLSLVAKEDLVAVDERVSPFDIFPSPEQTDMNNGSLIERMKLSRKSLYDSIGVPGYSETNIREVLKNYDGTGLSEWQTTVDSNRRYNEGHSTGLQTEDNMITALRFFGPVEVTDLKEWVKATENAEDSKWKWVESLDEDASVEIEAILIGTNIVKVAPNLDPLGHRKYYSSSYRKVPGSIWGKSVGMLVKPHARLVNATARALSNNMGIASGPMSYILIDRLPQGETLGAFYPWKQYQMTSDPTGANVPPISFFQPNDNSSNLLNVYQYYMNEAYAISGIPRGALDGATSRLGSGDHTASGVASEIENASKPIRMAVSNIERDVVTKRIKDQYYTNMIYSDNDEVKGDFQVVAKGASSSVAKAVDNQQSIELLNSVATGPGSELIGMEGVAAILGRIAKNNDMPDLVPTKEELKERMEQQAQQQPPPTPDEVKLQIEQLRMQSRLKDQALEDKNSAAEREVRMQIAQMDLQAKKMEHEVAVMLAKQNADQQLKVTALQGINANERAKQSNDTKLTAEKLKNASQKEAIGTTDVM